jgi:hypothetical protein
LMPPCVQRLHDLGAEDLLPEEDADLGEEIRRRRRPVGEAHAVRVGPDVGARVEQPLPQRRTVLGEEHLVGAELAALLIRQAETDDTPVWVDAGVDIEGEHGAGDLGGHESLDVFQIVQECGGVENGVSCRRDASAPRGAGWGVLACPARLPTCWRGAGRRGPGY